MDTIKVNDEIIINNIRYTIRDIWASGRHIKYIMTNGVEFIDLHLVGVKKVENPKVKKIIPEIIKRNTIAQDPSDLNI